MKDQRGLREILMRLRKESTYGEDEFGDDCTQEYNEDVDDAIAEIRSLVDEEEELATEISRSLYNVCESARWRNTPVETWLKARATDDLSTGGYEGACRRVYTQVGEQVAKAIVNKTLTNMGK